MANKHLHLNLKGEYFHAIRAGKKVEEYRLYNDYWRKRLEGYTIKTIQHPLFGDDPVKVFAIHCNIYWQHRF